MNGCQTCGGYGNRHDPVAHGWDLGAMNTDDLPVMHPDEIARQIQRTRDYIAARYGDGEIPRFYDEGGVLFAGPTLAYNDSGEDEEVKPS